MTPYKKFPKKSAKNAKKCSKIPKIRQKRRSAPPGYKMYTFGPRLLVHHMGNPNFPARITIYLVSQKKAPQGGLGTQKGPF